MKKKEILICMILVFLFLLEAGGLIYHSGEVTDISGNDVAYYQLRAKEYLDSSETIPGDIIDRNGYTIVSHNEVNDLANGEYGEDDSKWLYSYIIGTTGDGILGKYHDILNHVDSKDNKQDRLKGDSLVLTIDHNLQRETAETLVRYLGEDIKCSMVILDCDSGQILADVSLPSYDITNISDADQIDWYPLATNGQIAPGSIFKILSTIEMFEEGISDLILEDEAFYEDGGIKVYNYAGYEEYDYIDYREALRKSSNVFFTRALIDVDSIEEKMTNLVKNLSLGNELNLDFGTVTSRWTFDKEVKSAILDSDNIDSSHSVRNELAHTLYGQSEIRMSTLQAAMMMSGLLNGGNIMMPHMIKNVVDADNKLHSLEELVFEINEYNKQRYEIIKAKRERDKSDAVEEGVLEIIEMPEVSSGQIFSSLTTEDIAEAVLEALRYTAVAEYGFDESLAVAAKTGTAQAGANNETEHIWMVSCAEVNGHNYAIAINRANCGIGAVSAMLKDPSQHMYEYIKEKPIYY